MTPIVHGLAEEYGDTLRVLFLNVDEADKAAVQASYGLRGHPTIAVLDASGQLTARFFGVVTADALRQAITDQATPP